MDEKNAFNSDLDPEVIKVRDKIISKIGDKPLDEVNSIIKKLLSESMDEVTRLGALAARLKIIRSKIELLYERKVEIKPNKNIVKSKEPEKEDEKPKNKEEKWIRIKMLEAGDVNGKQIDKGVILDVKEGDSKKLLDSKKAEIVEELTQGASPIQKSQPNENKDKEKEEIKADIGDKQPEESKDSSESKEEVSVNKSDPKSEQKPEQKPTPSDEKKSDEDSVKTEKPKNLLEKHEDAVLDDDKESTENISKGENLSSDEKKPSTKDEDNSIPKEKEIEVSEDSNEGNEISEKEAKKLESQDQKKSDTIKEEASVDNDKKEE